ncbi:uncharacterized protein LOC119693798 [Plutella xylostella]|uniref:uncharacterized protein LOC119693798 n=1 Tax=Plutella xylostella TaxID=51655 RepID=UPI0018CFFE92|nr:uncharacterized protein LOC119693798 [Plutella xylostella]
MSTQNVTQRTPPNNLLRANNAPINESRSLEDIRNTKGMETTTGLSPETQKKLSQRVKRRREVDSDAIYDELAGFKSDIKDMIKELISAQNTRMDNLEQHMMELKKQFSTIKDTNKDIHVYMIEEKIENLDRNIIKTSIELRNVPKRPQETKENLFCLVKTLSQSINVTLQPHDIRDVSRQPSKRESPVSALVVEFSNTLIKSRILNGIKEFNKANNKDKMNSSHLGLDSPKIPIYATELLTNTSKRLYFLARTLAKSENYAFCWISNGRVLLRRHKDGPHIVVKDEHHLQQLSSKTPGK